MHLTTIELNPSKTAQRSIIWLHGLGADGDNFVPIVPELNIQEALRIRFIFPNAPIQAVTINGGMHMPAWYDIYAANIDAKIDSIGINQSRIAIEQLIEDEMKRGIPSQNIMLAGFSQGAVIALTTGLQYEQPLAGIIALSGYLPEANTVLQHLSANQKCPIFLAHGLADPIVPYELSIAAKNALAEAGVPLSFHSYQMPHSVCGDEIRDIAGWVERVFNTLVA